MTSEIKAKVSGIARKYANGLEIMEIHISLEYADELPFEYDKRIPIDLVVADRSYKAGLRSTHRNKYFWISPNVIGGDGAKLKLASVLTAAGFAKNQSVILLVSGDQFALRA